MHLKQTWVSALGDFDIDIEADTVHEIEALLQLAKEANIVPLQVEAIAKHVREIESFSKIKKIAQSEEEP